jgi:hypothetical protein
VSLVTIELVAAAFGVLGTVLLALRGPRAGWGFVAYLASNAAWLATSWAQGQWPLFTQQLAFMASSLLGIWLWILRPRAPTFKAVYRATRPYKGRIASARLALRCSR